MEWIVDVHSIFRWVVLVVAVGALVFSVLAAAGSRPWDMASERLALLFTIAMDIQVLIGILVWIFGQHWTGDTYVGWIHPALMIVAVALAHVGKARADRATDQQAKGKQATLFFGLSLAIVVLAVPISSWPI